LILFGIYDLIANEKSGILGLSIIISIFIILSPQLISNYLEFRKIREIESIFPNFLRDLVEASKAGLPLHKAIIFVSNTDYGPLSPEVKKMAHQLSWNVNLLKVLEQTMKRLKKSKTLTRVIRVMIETYKSGGSVDTTLDSLSNALKNLQDTERERKSMLGQYVISVYVVSVIFMGIVVAINQLMIPIFESMSATTGVGGEAISFGQNPCDSCQAQVNLRCLPCVIYFNICSIFGTETTTISCYYLGLFFSMSIMQAISGGLVAGQIGEGSVIAGAKHSLILVSITFGAFFVLVTLGLVG
jgi:flagellar protein FlaJ